MLLNKKNILLIIFSIAILAVFTGIVCADESGDSSFFSLDDIFHQNDKKEIKTTKVKIYNFKEPGNYCYIENRDELKFLLNF